LEQAPANISDIRDYEVPQPRRIPLGAPEPGKKAYLATSRPAPVSAVLPATHHHVPVAGGTWWFAKLPARLWFAANIMAVPFRILSWALNTAAAAAVVAVAGAGLAWWYHYITDDQVAWFIGQIGNRGLSIMGKSGVL
jgi:hypothetical protein